jgi:hypothetical protein
VAITYYPLVRCQKCEGDFYGPVGLRIEPEKGLELAIQRVEIELSATHPQHKVNGESLKRYGDFQFPNY